MVLKSRPVVTMAGVSGYFFRGQDGRVVKTSRHCEVLMLSRGIDYQVAHLVSTQKVYRLGGWCLSHVPSLLWQA